MEEGLSAERGAGLQLRPSPKDVPAGFRAGRFSLASDVFPADVEALRREPDYASGYRETPGLLTYYIALNANGGLLQEPALRQRLLGAIDVPASCAQTLGRLTLPAVSLILPGLVGHGQASRADATPTGGARPPGRRWSSRQPCTRFSSRATQPSPGSWRLRSVGWGFGSGS